MNEGSFARIGRFAGVLALTLFLWSCAALRPAPAYDALADAQLTALYGDTVGFVDRMIAAAGTQEGTFEVHRDFYVRAQATVDVLMVRAQARQSLGGCPTKAITDRALGAVNATSAAPYLEAAADDDCQILLFAAMDHSFEQMAAFHAAQGDRGIPPSARGPLLEGGVGAVLRAAIAVELAKSDSGRGRQR